MPSIEELQTRLDQANASLWKALNAKYQTGAIVRAQWGNGSFCGEVRGISARNQVIVKHLSSGRSHHKHWREVGPA